MPAKRKQPETSEPVEQKVKAQKAEQPFKEDPPERKKKGRPKKLVPAE